MFDTYSLHIAHIVSSLVVTLFAWAIVWSSESMRGARQWAFGLTLHLPALVLFLLRGRAPDFQTIVMANTLLILGSADQSGRRPAFCRLQGRIPASGCPFGAVRPSVRRSHLLVHGRAGHCQAAGRADSRHPGPEWRHCRRCRLFFQAPGNRPSAFFASRNVFYAVVSVARITLICQSNSPGVWSNTNHEYYMLASIAAVTAMAFSFSVMVTDVLHMRLQQQHAELQNNLQCRETLEAMIHHDLHGPPDAYSV